MQDRKKLVHKWSHLKSELRKRPLLAYKFGIPFESLQEYLKKTPSNERILEIERLLIEDRKRKTLMVCEVLNSIMKPRETVIYALKIGISDTKLRNIIDGKDLCPSYDIINKIEVFLNATMEYEIPIENQQYSGNFYEEFLGSISQNTSKVGKSIMLQSAFLGDLSHKMKRNSRGMGNDNIHVLERIGSVLERNKKELNDIITKLKLQIKSQL